MAEINKDQLCGLLRLKPSLEDVAAFFKCSPTTIQRFITAEYQISFRELREREMVHTRHDLIRKAIARADKSDTMLIFCLKNLCGWRDKQDDTPKEESQTTQPIILTDEQLKQLVKAARGLKAV